MHLLKRPLLLALRVWPQLVLSEHLLHARHWIVCFRVIISFNPSNNLMASTINIILVLCCRKKKPRLGRTVPCPKSHSY